MSLVVYDDSDSGSEEETITSSDDGDRKRVRHEAVIGNGGSDGEAITGSNPEPIVLPPKQITNLDFNLEVLDKNRSQPIRITIPSLNSLKEEDEANKKPKLKPSTKGSSLFSVLPKPKNVVSTSSPSLTPQSVMKSTQQKKPLPPPTFLKAKRPVLKAVQDDTDDNEESLSSFFFSEQGNLPVTNDNPVLEETMPDSTATLPSNESHTYLPDQSSSGPALLEPNRNQWVGGEDNSNQLSSTTEEEDLLDPAALIKLCGARERRKQSNLPEIIQVDGSSLITDNNIILSKELTRELPSVSFKRKSDCSSAQRRKHQITYLAEQAKAQELELRNNWAQNRMTRKQTQAKYGF